jgi:hypothetical protein
LKILLKKKDNNFKIGFLRLDGVLAVLIVCHENKTLPAGRGAPPVNYIDD